ncbi:MAG: ATP-dependent zinc protease [Acidimicrobiales bacterium]
MAKLHIGWREWVGLPGLGIDAVKAKIDTGARTSAIHAFGIQPFEAEGVEWVRFQVHPRQRSRLPTITCEAPIHDRRLIRSSNGQQQSRIIIKTRIEMAGATWPIELSLASRDELGFRMLIGRQGLGRKVLIDPARSYVTGKRVIERPT